MRSYTVIIAGVGGQGGLTLSRVIAQAALLEGYMVVVGETLGMSQRFGSVQSYVRLGSEASSPLPLDPADLIIGLEPLEAARATTYSGRNTAILTSIEPLDTQTTLVGIEEYPEIDGLLQLMESRADRVFEAEPLTASKKLYGTPMQANMLMLGAALALGLLPLSLHSVEEAVKTMLAGKSRTPINALRRAYHNPAIIVKTPSLQKQ